MTPTEARMTLREVLRVSLEQRLPCEELYLPRSEELRLDTPCLLLSPSADSEFDAAGIPVAAVSQGFPVEGLDRATINGTAQWARQFADPPPDDLLLESFVYYLRFDAFLPSPGALPPPSLAEIRRRLDREFYDALGAERSDVPCRKEGCTQGAVAQSVFCRAHHFEMVRWRPCPFTDPANSKPIL
jgi:hypothetical protein